MSISNELFENHNRKNCPTKKLNVPKERAENKGIYLMHSKISFFLYDCATCPKLPSNICTFLGLPTPHEEINRTDNISPEAIASICQIGR